MRLNLVILGLVVADKPNPKTDALAAKGPAAIAEALEAEYAKAEKAGDKEHMASLKKHWADYLSERKEDIEDHEGGHLDTREEQALKAGPEAVEAALAGELKEAEKFGDSEHIESIKKHEADYLNEAHGGGAERQEIAFRKDLANGNTGATEMALKGELAEALKYHDREHVESILAHYSHYNNKFFPNAPEGQAPWDYTYDLRAPGLEKAAYEHRTDAAGEMAAKAQQAAESRREMRLTHGASECHMPLNTQNPLKHAAGCRTDFNYGNWSLVYNALSFGIASMGSAMIFVWLMIHNVAKPYKPALAINGLVTGIATYHYFRIFNSWNDSFDVFYDTALERYVVNSSGLPFNDAYRYVDWLLTVPLLLIELILVMQLPAEESSRKMWSLGTASAFMVAFGYPGEIRDDPAGRWFYWSVSMCPFMYVLYELYVGLAEATRKHAPTVASLIASARYLTAISWLTYPFVYMIKGCGLSGGDATTYEQVGYSAADVTAKAVFGILVWRIAHEKTLVMESQGLLK